MHRKPGPGVRISGLGFHSDFGFRVSGFRRSAFSFAEVMFAVVILGIGFIMVAAIFPVAIQQTQSTGEENIAALAARDAADAIISLPATIANPWYDASYNAATATPQTPYKAIANYSVFPPTVKSYQLGPSGSVAPPAIVVPFTGTRWKMVQSDTIVVSDQRYAYVPFYRRENGSGSAELIVISVAVRNKPVYAPVNDALNYQYTASVTTASMLNPPTGSTPPTAPTDNTTIYPDTIMVTNASGTGPSNSPVEGSAVIAPTPSNVPGAGRTYTLGHFLGGSTWEINPGDGLALTAGKDGNWGTIGATIDPILAGNSCVYNTSTTLQPLVAYATLQTTPTNPAGQITLMTNPGGNPNPGPANAGPGAFVIIADDLPFNPARTNLAPAPAYNLLVNSPNLPAPNNALNPPYYVGALNGRIFRLASLVGQSSSGAGTTYNLDPAYGMRPPTPGGDGDSPDTVPSQAMGASAGGIANLQFGQFGVKCYIVGVGQVTTNGVTSYTGSAQDIGVFATYFPVR